MKAADCQQVRRRFPALEDEALSAQDGAVLRDHLGECPRCRAAWERWQADGRLLAEALRPEIAPRDIAGGALAAVRRRPAREPVLRRRPVVWGAVAAAAVALLAAGILVLQGQRYPEIGTVVRTMGQPQARQRGASRASLASPGMSVFDGDRWLTGAGDRAELEFEDGSRVVVEARSEVWLSGMVAAEGCEHYLPHVCLRRGEVLCDLESPEHFRAVGTPLGTAITRGARFRMSYEPGVAARLEVVEGTVRLSCPAAERECWPGSVWIVKAETGLPELLSEDQRR
ncbi:MAG: FecR domain-containing protein [Candidatus Brocadiia bacterium]